MLLNMAPWRAGRAMRSSLGHSDHPPVSLLPPPPQHFVLLLCRPTGGLATAGEPGNDAPTRLSLAQGVIFVLLIGVACAVGAQTTLSNVVSWMDECDFLSITLLPCTDKVSLVGIMEHLTRTNEADGYHLCINTGYNPIQLWVTPIYDFILYPNSFHIRQLYQ